MTCSQSTLVQTTQRFACGPAVCTHPCSCTEQQCCVCALQFSGYSHGALSTPLLLLLLDVYNAVCHRSSTQEKTVNQVLSLFFVPLFTVHKGQPYRVCSQCGWDSKQSKHALCT
jgi:hypothetical protein